MEDLIPGAVILIRKCFCPIMGNAFQLLTGIVRIRDRIPVCICLACNRPVRRLVRFRKDRVPAGRCPGLFPIRIIRERIEKPVMADGGQTVPLILIRDGCLMAAAVPVRDGFCSLRDPVPVIIRIGDRPPFRIRGPGEQPPGRASVPVCIGRSSVLTVFGIDRPHIGDIPALIPLSL